MRRLIVGDIHGEYEKLISLLDAAAFNRDADMLYSLGDFTDRGEQPYEVLSFLRSLSNFKAVIGNHDLFLQYWLLSGIASQHWVGRCGGDVTIHAFHRQGLDWKDLTDYGLWLKSLPVVILEEGCIITHGGIPPDMTVSELESLSRLQREGLSTDPSVKDFIWDRTYFEDALSGGKRCFGDGRTIFIGHTPLEDDHLPFVSASHRLVALDTGAGYEGGRLTLYDMDSGRWWQA